MKKFLRIPLLIMLTVVLNLGGHAQTPLVLSHKKDSAEKDRELSKLSMDIYTFEDKVNILELELKTLKALAIVDSLQFGKDSLLVEFRNANRALLKTIKQKFHIPERKYDDSTVIFYNRKGLVEYQELWHVYKNVKVTQNGELVEKRTRLTCRKYEYDENGRLVRYAISSPTPKMMETIYVYDSSGRSVKTIRNIHPMDFWNN